MDNVKNLLRSAGSSMILTVVMMLAGTSRSNVSQSVIRGPYLQSGNHNSVVIRWRTDTPIDSRVLYGTEQGDLAQSEVDPAMVTEHIVRLSGLKPDTTYFYGVGTSSTILVGDDPEHFFLTSPVPSSPKSTRIWVLGDSGTGDINAKAVRDAYYSFTGSRHTDLWMLLGDNAYNSGTDAEYQSNFFDIYSDMIRKSVFWPTLGNHDGRSADSATQSGVYYDIFTLPRTGEAGGVASGTEAYYSFDYANVHFVCLDSFESDRSASSPMLTWLQQDLSMNTRLWLIAFWHHPPYTQGSHNSDFEVELIEMRENALPILEAAGVDLVLTGHSHSYERSFLLDGHYGSSSTFSSSHVIDGGDGRPDGNGPYQKSEGANLGAVYIVAGSSGKISGGSLSHPAMFVSVSQLGSLVLDVQGNQLDIKFLNRTGDFSTDYFRLSKTPTTVDIVGKVNYQGGSQSVPGVSFELTGDKSETATTGEDGAFTFEVDTGGSVMLTPSKETDVPTNRGVTTLDLALIRRHILALHRFPSPYQILAADVDKSLSVTSLDIALIRQMILAITDSFPGGLWRFARSDFEFSDPLNPWSFDGVRSYAELSLNQTGQNFVGIKYGDVNESWTESTRLAPLSRIIKSIGSNRSLQSYAPEVTFRIGDGEGKNWNLKNNRRSNIANPESTIRFPVSISDFQNVTSAQFTLEWDSETMKYAGVEVNEIRGLRESSFGTRYVGDGKLTFSWDDSEGTGMNIKDRTVLFTIAMNEIMGNQSGLQLWFADQPTLREVSVDGKLANMVTLDGVAMPPSATRDSSDTLIRATVVDGILRLVVATDLERNYRVEWSEAVAGMKWNPLIEFEGNGTDQIIEKSIPSIGSRFYRVRTR